jgi:acyl-CoA thioesterase YciA
MSQHPSQIAEQIQNWTMVFPNQANPNGNMFGGDLLAIMDTTAAMAAKRYSQMDVSTVTVEAVHFAKPFMVGDNIKTLAKVVAVGHSSMMVKAEAYRDVGNDRLEKHVTAFFNLVAFDSQRQPAQVPQLKFTDADNRDHKQALIIKDSAKQRSKALLMQGS